MSNTQENKFSETFCSQCGKEFGPGSSGYSHCEDHINTSNPYTGMPATYNCGSNYYKGMVVEVSCKGEVVNFEYGGTQRARTCFTRRNTGRYLVAGGDDERFSLSFDV